MPRNLLLLLAGLFGAIGIAARAFEAHGLISLPDISEPRIRDFSSGTEMLLIHALALLGLAAIAESIPRVSLWAGLAFVIGVALFASPLLAYGLTGSRAVIMLTPIGGIAMIAGWLMLAIGGALGIVRGRAR